ncbi:MAG TPA: hypothetical protein VFC16_02100 [Nakamurella sp.]|jgi:hypothetical protein|nr:hypothetical protein [Nakamurella sp.]
MLIQHLADHPAAVLGRPTFPWWTVTAEFAPNTAVNSATNCSALAALPLYPAAIVAP